MLEKDIQGVLLWIRESYQPNKVFISRILNDIMKLEQL